jgi:hypothetical protein
MNTTRRARDEALRPTPYELAFPDEGFAESRFSAMDEEALSRDANLDDPGAFLLLAQVGRVLRELGGETSSTALVPTFGAFLFHAFHFHRSARPAFLVETSTLRYLLEADAAPDRWGGELPAPAGYLQLPRHLLWARPDGEDGPAEAVDGIFWTRSSQDTLNFLAVTGIRGDRPGFSVLPVPPVPLGEVVNWMTRRAREEGEDFATTLPGGEMDRLYSLETAGEVVKLAARILAHAVTVEGALGAEEVLDPSPETESDDGPGGASDPDPRSAHRATAQSASRLPFRRIRLAG